MDKYTFILIILRILAGISLTIFITDLVKFCKKKKEKRRNWNFNDKTNFSRQYLDPLNYLFEGGWFNDLGDREALENAYVESKKPKEK